MVAVIDTRVGRSGSPRHRDESLTCQEYSQPVDDLTKVILNQ